MRKVNLSRRGVLQGTAAIAAGLAAPTVFTRQAWAAYTTLSAEEIDRYLFTLNQLRRDPEERKQENLAEDYAAWKEDNQETFREAMGLKFRRPDD